MDRRQITSLMLTLLVLVGGVILITDGRAKHYALTHEEAYLQAQLENASCINTYGTYETTTEKQASVIDHRLDGVVVRVNHPYSYSTNQTEADSSSKATYFVGIDITRRVEGEPLYLPC